MERITKYGFRKMKEDWIYDKEWKWAWNGNMPLSLLEIVFFEAQKKFKGLFNLNEFPSLTYSEEWGKNLTAYFSEIQDLNQEFVRFFKNNSPSFINDYLKLISETEKYLEKFKSYNNKINLQKVDTILLKEIKQLLSKNNAYFLMLQPEKTKTLENLNIDLIKTNFTNFLKEKKEDFNKIIKEEKNNKKLIRDHYWKYRSFYLINFDVCDIKKEEEQLIRELSENKDLILSDDEILNRDLAILGDLRLRGKNAWVNLALLFVNIMYEIAEEYQLSKKEIISYSFDELLELIENRKKLLEEEINKREKYLLFRENSEIGYLFGEEAETTFKNIVFQLDFDKIGYVKGEVGYSGKIVGRVFKISLQDDLTKKIEEAKLIKNMILVAEQTVPSYLPLFPNCKGIITNEGGILSHAAIISREFKIPSLIGTEYATKVFKNGDLVEIDTEKQVARKIKENC